jgi:hypothetical protein
MDATWKVSLAWSKGWQSPEFISSKTGKLVDGNPSKLSIFSLFRKFKIVTEKLGPLISGRVRGVHLYFDAKKLAKEYQTKKRAVEKAFKDKNLGKWTHKPTVLSTFWISEGNYLQPCNYNYM